MATSGVNKSQMLLKRMTFSLLPELRPLNVKNGLFFVFSADDSKKKQSQFGQSILFERSHFSKSFGKCYGFLDSELP